MTGQSPHVSNPLLRSELRLQEVKRRQHMIEQRKVKVMLALEGATTLIEKTYARIDEFRQLLNYRTM